MHYSDKMKLKIEDIIIWVTILLTIGVAIWMLYGSPTESSAIIAVALFVATSELMIWRKLFSIEKNSKLYISKIDKNVSISFMKMKNNIDRRFSEVDTKLDNINNLLIKRR